MIIKGYLPTSVIEWPGKISAVIFTGGCNFRCPYCHNPELVKSEGLPASEFARRRSRAGRRAKSENNVLNDLGKRKKWLDAVVITGGEPTLQTDLGDFLGKVKALGLKAMIETNGSRPDVIARLLNPPAGRAGCQIVDRFAIDIKGPLDRKYSEIIRYKDIEIQEKIKKSLKIIMASGVDFELRTTMVPGIHDEKTIGIMARQIIQQTTNNKQQSRSVWLLQTFRPKKCFDPEFEKTKPYTQKEMEKMLKIAQKILPNTRLR